MELPAAAPDGVALRSERVFVSGGRQNFLVIFLIQQI